VSLPLTPDILEGVYEFLRRCPPFRGWKLPEPDAVEFTVLGARDREAHYTRYKGTDEHIIGVSSNRVGLLPTLIVAMGHEMIHLKQAVTKTETPGVQHNAEYRRIAKQVCQMHGWDFAAFVGT